MIEAKMSQLSHYVHDSEKEAIILSLHCFIKPKSIFFHPSKTATTVELIIDSCQILSVK